MKWNQVKWNEVKWSEVKSSQAKLAEFLKTHGQKLRGNLERTSINDDEIHYAHSYTLTEPRDYLLVISTCLSWSSDKNEGSYVLKWWTFHGPHNIKPERLMH